MTEDASALQEWIKSGTVSEGYIQSVLGDRMTSVSPHTVPMQAGAAAPLTAIILGALLAKSRSSENTLGSDL